MLKNKKLGSLDVFLIFMVLVAGLAGYFTFIKPLSFSGQIIREGTRRYAEIEVLLFDELAWMKDVLKAKDAYTGLYGELEWEILEIEEAIVEGKARVRVQVKARVIEDQAGNLRYEKNHLLIGNSISFMGKRYVFAGRIYDFQIIDDKVPI